MSKNIDLGLALLDCPEFRAAVGLPPMGVPLTQDEIAAVCGCTRQNVSHIERKATRKLRHDEVANELAKAAGFLRKRA